MAEFPHECRVRVRYADTDQMGIVHHANYLAYMEEARTLFMEALGLSYAEVERRGFGLAVRKVEIRYRAPARYGDELRVRTRVAELGKASVRFEYEVRSEDASQLLAAGSTELACVDLKAGMRPLALPEELARLLAAGSDA